MKRKLALIMATAVIAGTVPAIPAHAATDLQLSGVKTVPDTGLVKTGLFIEEDQFGITTGGTFRIMLNDGAEFTTDGSNLMTAADFVVSDVIGSGTVQVESVNEKDVVFKTTGKITSFKINQFPVYLDGAAKGEQKLVLEDRNDSNLSRKEATFAVVSSSDKVVSRMLESKKVVSRGGIQTGAKFEIKELVNAAFDSTKTVEFKLPYGFAWETTAVDYVGATGVIDTTDKRILKITPANNAGAIDIMTITPKFSMDKDARMGDVAITVSDKGGMNGSSIDDLVVAEYKDYGFSLKVDKEKEIIAGNKDENSNYKVKVTIETPKNTMVTNRDIDFTVTGGDVKKTGSVSGFTGTSFSDIDAKYDDEFVGRVSATDRDKYEFELYLKADYDATGDMKLEVKVPGFDKQEVKLATVKAPVTLEAKKGDGKLADVRIGVQGQDAAEITLTEAKGGALKKGLYVLDFDKDNYGMTFNVNGAKNEVADGDLVLEDIDTEDSNGRLLIEVKNESRKASKIVIKGVKLNLDRTVPEGVIQARLAAVVDANGEVVTKYSNRASGTDGFEKITKFDFINVVTAAPGANKTTTVFTLDTNKYTVVENGVTVEKQMDVAPAVVDGRALLPIRYVANALGVKDDAILWDNATRTATFFKGDRVVKMTLGSKTLIVNGTPVEMEVAPVVKSDRAMVPVRALANAFGVNLNWDDAARTITVEY